MIRGLVLAVWYSRVDLFSQGAWKKTMVNVCTVALAVAFALMTFGLLFGYEQVELAAIRSDPLNLSLRVEEKVATGGVSAGVSVSPPKLKDLKKALADQSAGRLGVFPYRQTTYSFFRDESPEAVNHSLQGRTVLVDPNEPTRSDPFFKSRPLEEDGRPGIQSGPRGDAGIILTHALIQKLELDSAKLPQTISLNVAGRPRRNVAILGVIRPVAGATEDLPLGHWFVVSERLDDEVNSQTSDKKYETIYTGEVPDNWPAIAPAGIGEGLNGITPGVPQAALDYLGETHIRLYRDGRKGGPRRWRAKSMDGSKPYPTVSEWSALFDGLRKHFKDGDKADSFIIPDTGVKAAALAKVLYRTDYNFVVIYAETAADLAQVASICKGLDLRFNGDIVDRIVTLDKMKAMALGLLSFAEGALILLAVWNLWAVQVLRAQAQRCELGMLKAMGISSRSLRTICLVEGAITGLFGVALGLLGGVTFGLGIAGVWYQGNPLKPGLGFAYPTWIYAASAVASVLFCVVSAWAATASSRRASAGTLLRGEN